MKRAAVVFLLLWSISLAPWAATTCEIEHLLRFIESSECSFVRNGEGHEAPAARTHIERKYAHTKRWVKTAEQFIEYTATKSSTSGDPYYVICSGREELSADWLLQELARLRAEAACSGN